MLTIHKGKDQLEKAFAAGIDDFVNKPFTEPELIARLRAGMRAGRRRRAVFRKAQWRR